MLFSNITVAILYIPINWAFIQIDQIGVSATINQCLTDVLFFVHVSLSISFILFFYLITIFHRSFFVILQKMICFQRIRMIYMYMICICLHAYVLMDERRLTSRLVYVIDC